MGFSMNTVVRSYSYVQLEFNLIQKLVRTLIVLYDFPVVV